jgi:ATPase subunit of ABC transporter with duplicated ATPase domains
MPASITLSALSFAPPDGRVLFSDLSFSFNQERTARVGRNGAGQTTFLKLVAGQHAPSAGRVSLTCTVGTLGQLQAVPDDMTFADLFGVRRAPRQAFWDIKEHISASNRACRRSQALQRLQDVAAVIASCRGSLS